MSNSVSCTVDSALKKKIRKFLPSSSLHFNEEDREVQWEDDK